MTALEREVSLRISYDKDKEEIILETLNPERFTHYGFGTFLENIDPREISISEQALEALLQCPERKGLQGLEFWPDNRMAWGAPSVNLRVPYDSINCPKEAKCWLRECEVYQEEK